MHIAHTSVLLVAASLGSACQDPPANARDAQQAASSGSELERFFPLEANKLYAYNTEEGGERGILTTRSSRSSKQCGELTASGKPKRFCYEAAQVLNERGFAILKLPIAVGNQWNSSSTQQCEISAIGVSAHVPAGNLSGCIEVTERAQGTAAAALAPRTITTYCPLIGIAKLEVFDGKGGSATVVLKSYAAPIE